MELRVGKTTNNNFWAYQLHITASFTLNLYKHGITRTYIHLDDAGNCYIPMGNGCYASADWEQELMLLEDCLKRLSATLETSYDAKFITEKRQKLQREGISLLTLEVQPGDFTIH